MASEQLAVAPTDKERYEANWEGLRLVVEQRPAHYQAFVTIRPKCEVLYTCGRLRLDLAQFAVVEFAASIRFGLDHFLKIEIVGQTIAWQRARQGSACPAA
jgi:hypothetical protein